MNLKICFIAIFLINAFVFAEIRYVSKTGSSTPPYTSWETAADSIQKAIDASWIDDTIIVANGTYYESLYINRTIHLIGSSMDSTIINGTNISGFNILYLFENSSTIQNFTITSSNSQRNGIVTMKSNIGVKHCRITNLNISLNINFSSVNISDLILKFYKYGIRDECPADTCHSVYINNIIYGENVEETPVLFAFGGKPTFINNIVIESGYCLRGVDLQYISGGIVKNNLVSGYEGVNIRAGQIVADTVYFENNISLNSEIGYSTSTAHRTVIRNNIAKDVLKGIQASNGAIVPDYNLFWNVGELTGGTASLGNNNIISDPMLVKDTIPRIGGTYDFHLQKYSPAIDNGDPNILDKDGTRSDIGMYGGPLGETYTYQDLAPRPPTGLSASIDTSITIKWKRNTEADIGNYKLFRDTVVNFTVDSTKLISTQPDTFYTQLSPAGNHKYYYKLKAVDNQGNESELSLELYVNITSAESELIISDYKLYQNYPNPFNPNTTISYQLVSRGYVKIMVYDIKGELIKVLVNESLEAGYYETEFNGDNLSSGIYLYRIEVIGEGRIPVYSEMKKNDSPKINYK